MDVPNYNAIYGSIVGVIRILPWLYGQHAREVSRRRRSGMAVWVSALFLLVVLAGGCAAGSGQSSAPGFQDERQRGEGGPNGGMSGGSM